MPNLNVQKSAAERFVFGGHSDNERFKDRRRQDVQLCRSDLVTASLVVLRKDGANNLHSHTGNDGTWFVLKGRAAFYGDGDEPIANLGVGEGVLIPRGLPYWFESANDDEALEILHVACLDPRIEDTRINHRPHDQKGRAPAPAATPSAAQ